MSEPNTEETQELVGMYRVNDPDYQKVTVGKYTICKQDDQSVWIQNNSVGGGQFSNELFEKAIDEFFGKHF